MHGKIAGRKEHFMNKVKELVVIGGGPAGMAAALSAYEKGIRDILILERDGELGGILNQCIHTGFGLHTFKEELTGPEYAARYIEMIDEKQIPSLLRTMVTDIQPGKPCVITAMNRNMGMFQVRADAVVLAMGCRERPRGAMNIPGFRPAGIYSAGTVQRYVNMEGRMPGKEIVILGSGDIGLIMARRMTLQGAKVKLVAEIMPYSGGLRRNIAQCLDDYGIPLKLNHTVTKIHGKDRVEGVTVSAVDENLNPIPGSEEYVSCDTVLLSCGLIPENELTQDAGAKMDDVTQGPIVNEKLETTARGIFACGNVLHVHDLVDYVSEESAEAGRHAAFYVGQDPLQKAAEDSGGKETGMQGIAVKCAGGVRYTVPSLLRPAYMQEEQMIRFRVGDIYKNVCLTVRLNDTVVMRRNKRIMAPGEMEQFKLKKSRLEDFEGLSEITVSIEKNP